MNDENTKGLVLGGAASVLYWWSRNENDRDRRLRDLRADNRDLSERFNDFLSTGDVIRLQLPVVRDALTGIAEASAGTSAPSPVPNPPSFQRPNTSSGGNIPFLQWPPAVPNYDKSGNTNVLGEMAVAFRSLTYQENRAWNQGLNLPQWPSASGLMQIFYAAQGLTHTVSSLGLTLDQYKAAWANLFGSGGGSLPAGNHQDPSRPPSIAPAGGIGILPLTSLPGGIPGYPWANRNTDIAMRFRVTAPAGGVAAGGTLGQVTFGSEFRYRDASTGQAVPFQPAVPLAVSNQNVAFGATNITSTGFTLINKDTMVANSIHDVTITVMPGIETV